MESSDISSMQAASCPFCLDGGEVDQLVPISANSLAYAVFDKYPVSKGHTLVISKHHLASIFEASAEELRSLAEQISSAKAHIDKTYSPDGYNIGINDGESAGQTIQHLHIHVIPRYKGDIADPRGGVRWVFPDKAGYWEFLGA